MLNRAHGIADPREISDPSYAEGLRHATSAALDYALEAIESGERRAPPPPPVLLVQARVAARSGVSLDTVLRRYIAGYALIGDFLANEARQSNMSAESLTETLSESAAVFDRLLAAVSEEHRRETENRPGSGEQLRAARIERLLAGEPLDTSEFDYDFEAHHTALIAKGHDVIDVVRGLAGAVGRRLLLVGSEDSTVWAWLGGRQCLDPVRLKAALAPLLPSHGVIALGEPGYRLAGWRLSHRQAAAALPIARRRRDACVRYADVALVASAFRDDLLAASLRQIYLIPLEHERDGGKVARETLNAYFAAHRNVSSAAAALGVNRNTVKNRLQALEERLGRPLDSMLADLEVALRLEDIHDLPLSVASADVLPRPSVLH